MTDAPELSCGNCRVRWPSPLELCPACDWTPTGPSAPLRSSARRWAIGLGWWSMACMFTFVALGLMNIEARQKNVGAVLLTWGAVYGAGVLVAAYRRGAGVLILALHASTGALTAFASVSRAVGVEASRETGLWLLLHLLNASLFVTGLTFVSRAEKGGASLLRTWAAGGILGIAGMWVLRGSPDLFALSSAVLTLGATIAGINIVKGGDRGLRFPGKPLLGGLLALGGAALLSGAGWLYTRGLFSIFDRAVAGPILTFEGVPIGLKIACFVLLIPACEELLFRGAIQGRLRVSWDPLTALLSTAALFALVHRMPLLLPWHFVLGTALGWARERSGSLLPGFLIHAAVNAIALLAVPIPD